MPTVYLSPHLDDAVLSCGGRIALSREKGRRQLVITLFAGVPAWPDAERDAAYVERRRAEDREAFAALGVEEVVHLDLLDGIYRRGREGGWLYEARSMCGPVHGEDASSVRPIAALVRKHLPQAADAQVFAPLGVGGHVDHVLAHRVGRALARSGYTVRFYEDLPYALDRHRLQAALARRKRWALEACALSGSHLQRKLAALGCYRSQLGPFGGDGRMQGLLREHAASVSVLEGGFAERAWSPAR